jgi:peptidoglycan/xylan/chitin deacetylase (PgdA/CDA1 family)
MRRVVAFSCLLASITWLPASASDCPENPQAIGTSRTIVVDPAEHHRVGGYQYSETLPLEDREVVLTFDDGPLPPHTNRVLDVLARECVRATFFMIGRMAREFPNAVRRVHAEGHNVASHSMTHPYSFYRMTILDAAFEIEESVETLRAALGDGSKAAPFFRFPGLHRQDAIERYLLSKGMMTWSVDFMADDWMHIGSREVVRRALSRLEARGKGILLLHDIKPGAATSLQYLLNELKSRGFRIVHVVAATSERPKTMTTAEQWVVTSPPTREQLGWREPSMWPRALPRASRPAEPGLAMPGLTSFGVDSPHAIIPIDLVASPDMLRTNEPVAWPEEVAVDARPATELLPVPAADNFRLARLTHSLAKRNRQRGMPIASFASPTAATATATPEGAASGEITGSIGSGRLKSVVRATYNFRSRAARWRYAGFRHGGVSRARRVGHQIAWPSRRQASRAGSRG